MKLHEAIRLGAMQVPATERSGRVVVYDDYGRPCAACAFGTIMVAAGLATRGTPMFAAYEFGALGARFPLLNRVVRQPNRKYACSRSVGDIISLLFEVDGWTREQIADWVQTIEEPTACGSSEVTETETVATAVRLVPQEV